MENWVTVARYSALADVDMARGRLEAAGIEAWIEGEQSASSNVLGMPYTRLKVPEAQAEEASRILESLDIDNEEADTEADEIPDSQDLAWVEVAQCSSLCEADIVCSRLRSDGLDARVQDDCCMVLGSGAVGRMADLPIVIVPTHQATDAIEILKALEDSDELEDGTEVEDTL